jgi:hypothetical protein
VRLSLGRGNGNLPRDDLLGAVLVRFFRLARRIDHHFVGFVNSVEFGIHIWQKKRRIEEK